MTVGILIKLLSNPQLSTRSLGKEVGSNETEPTPEDDVIGGTSFALCFTGTN